jgi:sulfate adenylyltransferase subunit 2
MPDAAPTRRNNAKQTQLNPIEPKRAKETMNTVAEHQPTLHLNQRHLASLESEAIHIMREVAAECANPALLFSGGKDSVVLLRLAEKAFRPGKFPFPLVHVDTGHNFAEVIAFRDRRVAELGERLIVGSVEESIQRGTVRLRNPATDSRNAAQAVTLLETIALHKFDACIGGARRDEEKARAKERIFSFRDEFGQWDPKAQRPELWDLYNTRVHPGENMRVFPISNWTELDVWQYIAREKLALPTIYFAHQRQVIPRNGLLVPLTDLTPALAGERIETQTVRFRTVGDISCTCPVASDAATVDAIIAETAITQITERGATRMDDQTSEASMEKRKKAGYF